MSKDKRKLFAELIEEVRLSQQATARFDQAVADALGLNRTDMRCLDVIEREGQVTAGRLAEATGLTAGAMTTALDRLERSGHARRVHDPADRRKVLVELTAEARSHGENFWGAHQAHSEELYRRYTTEQIELLLDFVRAGRELNEREAAALETRNRRRS
jgi:DNA-binding MarR family transcriptional regulator